MSRAIAALLLLVATSVGALAQSLPVPSQWTSQDHSYLEFDQMVSSAEFVGDFVDHNPNFACANFMHKLSGFVHGAKVTFSVYWWQEGPAQCGETSWTGHVSGSTITAHWVHTVKGSPNTYGTDTFTRHR